RLDRDTSGCLLIAKRRSYLTHFHEQLRLKQMKKEYLAIVSGDWNNQHNQLSAPLKKNQLKSGERFVTVDDEGKHSETRFKCLKRFGQQSLIRALPLTGRTHQIRVHAQYAGCPLLGDKKYNEQQGQQELANNLGLKTFLLHAHKLSFSVPDSDKMHTYQAEIPAIMNRVIDELSEANK
ncbi:MAG: pseudouridine synthase, partial [Kangiellaceae bacterium]|nr:pseudouridine synthase [Kangiellaceae bacterium]